MTPNERMLSLVPDGWFRKYLDVMVKAKNETPLPFHMACALAVAGQLLAYKNYMYINTGKKVYPHVNTLLLGPAGAVRRSEGSRIAVEVADIASCNVFAGKLTPEGLLDELQERSQQEGVGDALLYVDELSVVLNKREYMSSMVPTLTDLLTKSGKYEERTRGAGRKWSIDRVNLSAIFTTAPDWFFDQIPDSVLKGGFLSRFLVCYIEKREVFCINPDPPDEKEWDSDITELGNGLAVLVGRVPKGQVKCTAEAKEWLKEWYEESEKEPVVDDRLSPSKTRRPANLLRVSMLLAMANGEDVVTLDRMKQALAIITYFDNTLATLLGVTDAIQSPIRGGEAVVLAFLGGREGSSAPHKDVMNALSRVVDDPGTRKKCLTSLEERGKITRIGKPGQPTGYWPPLAWSIDVRS